MGVGDTVSNNVSRSIISLLKVVTERKLQGDMFVKTFHSYFLSFFFTIKLQFEFLTIRIFSKMLTDKYHGRIQVSVRCKIA